MSQRVTSSVPIAVGTGLITLDLVMNSSSMPVQSWAGGTCGNVLMILAYLGWNSYPVARLNGDPASQRVRADMKRWGVKMNFASCEPTAPTPVIIQKIKMGKDGLPSHHFSMCCPQCGRWLPSYKSVTAESVQSLGGDFKKADIFFMDRLSRAALSLAKRASENGTLVVYEPSIKADEKYLDEALKIAHVLKYADQRFSRFSQVAAPSSSVLFEIQTQGMRGLKFRRLKKGAMDWEHLDAVVAPNMVDSCGSGDWCTAGFLAKAASGGLKGFLKNSTRSLRDALVYGQSLAAWNCGFEGARGGMYLVSEKEFRRQIDDIMSGRLLEVAVTSKKKVQKLPDICPACVPELGVALTH